MIGVDSVFLASTFLISVCKVAFVICCVVLILLVLIQRGGDEGLGTALGGGGGSDSILGVKSAQAIKKVTTVVAITFMVLALILAKFNDSGSVTDNPTTTVTTEN